MEIKEMVYEAYKNARDHGFYNNYEKALNKYISNEWNVEEAGYFKEVSAAFISNYINLIISELGEATQELRNGNNESMVKELADVYIRLSSLIGALGYAEDIEDIIKHKMEENKNRPYKHGKVI